MRGLPRPLAALPGWKVDTHSLRSPDAHRRTKTRRWSRCTRRRRRLAGRGRSREHRLNKRHFAFAESQSAAMNSFLEASVAWAAIRGRAQHRTDNHRRDSPDACSGKNPPSSPFTLLPTAFLGAKSRLYSPKKNSCVGQFPRHGVCMVSPHVEPCCPAGSVADKYPLAATRSGPARFNAIEPDREPALSAARNCFLVCEWRGRRCLCSRRRTGIPVEGILDG